MRSGRCRSGPPRREAVRSSAGRELVPGIPGLIIHHLSPRERRVALEQRVAFRILGRVALASPLLFRGSPRAQRSAGALSNPERSEPGAWVTLGSVPAGARALEID